MKYNCIKYFLGRSKQRENMVEQCEHGELCVMEPTAPPFENSE